MSTFNTDGQDEGNGNEYRPEKVSDQKQAVMAIRQIADFPDEPKDIDDACNVLRDSWMRFTELKAAFKAEEARHKERCMLLCESFGIKQVDLYEGKKLIYKVAKENVFDSEKIKEALHFSEKQLAVLPLNPAWKKSAVESIPETCTFVQVVEKMELKEDKPKAKKELTEFDPRFIK